MKTQEELKTLKKEVESLTEKLKELTEDELNDVVGGMSENLRFIPIVVPYSSAKPLADDPLENAA